MNYSMLRCFAAACLATLGLVSDAHAQCAQNEIAKLLRNDGAAGDFFGSSVAISSDTAIVGAFADTDNGTSSGSAYLFNATTGRQITKLLPDDGGPEDFFGHSVAISGATAIVGAAWDDDNGDNSGSVYLFDTTTGKQIAKLLPNDGAEWDLVRLFRCDQRQHRNRRSHMG